MFAPASQASQGEPAKSFYFRYSKGGCDGLCSKFSVEIREDNYLHLETAEPVEGSSRWRIRLSADVVRSIADHVEDAHILRQATIDCTGIGLGEHVTMLVYRSNILEFTRHIDFNCKIDPEQQFKHAIRTLEDQLPIWDLIGELGQ